MVFLIFIGNNSSSDNSLQITVVVVLPVTFVVITAGIVGVICLCKRRFVRPSCYSSTTRRQVTNAVNERNIIAASLRKWFNYKNYTLGMDVYWCNRKWKRDLNAIPLIEIICIFMNHCQNIGTNGFFSFEYFTEQALLLE